MLLPNKSLAVVAGLVASMNGGLNLVVANGGPGTGNGVVGGAAAVVLGLFAMAVGGLAGVTEGLGVWVGSTGGVAVGPRLDRRRGQNSQAKTLPKPRSNRSSSSFQRPRGDRAGGAMSCVLTSVVGDRPVPAVAGAGGL